MKLKAIDFERLTECQMEFNAVADWQSQSARFVDGLNWNHAFIYWCENYASTLLACQYLEQKGFSYEISWDDAIQQYCFTTDYAGSWVKA
jgi:hypothetical protein